MKNFFLFVLICCSSFSTISQNEFPSVNSSFNISTNNYNSILEISTLNTFDLSKFEEFNSEFKIIAHNNKKFVLEHSYSSLNKSKGRCAAGLEKKLLFLSFDENFILIKSENYLLESCLFSVEITKQEKKTEKLIIYHCENIQTLDSYQLQVDLLAIDVERIKIN